MTNEEAKELLEYMNTFNPTKGRRAEALEAALAIRAFEKQEPKKWEIYEDVARETIYTCPTCKEDFSFDEWTPNELGYKYCPICGQRLD